MARRRRTYSAEFKQQAVVRVTKQGYSFAHAARQLGVSENVLRSWKKRHDERGQLAFPRPR